MFFRGPRGIFRFPKPGNQFSLVGIKNWKLRKKGLPPWGRGKFKAPEFCPQKGKGFYSGKILKGQRGLFLGWVWANPIISQGYPQIGTQPGYWPEPFSHKNQGFPTHPKKPSPRGKLFLVKFQKRRAAGFYRFFTNPQPKIPLGPGSLEGGVNFISRWGKGVLNHSIGGGQIGPLGPRKFVGSW